ncbi:MAG: aldose 1-epimerase family protein [Clostridia bacterium]|nr:aldose 1-epimerase family protein [Clostridia bacterium]
MITIKNEHLTVKISEVGAELKSLICEDEEYIWYGDEKIWAMSAPHVFPICGGLKDNEYYLDNEKYSLGKHGYVRFELFEVENATDISVTFLHKANEETKKQFPFDYELRITYQLSGKTLLLKYDVKNCSTTDMYFSIGGHTGYYCPEGIEEYDLILPEKETLFSNTPVGSIIGNDKEKVLEDSDTLALDYKYFAVDALVFEEIKARSVILKNRNTGKALRFAFDGSDYFLLWTKPDAPYICLEAWSGIGDHPDTDKNLKTKEGIITLAKGESYTLRHSTEIL